MHRLSSSALFFKILMGIKTLEMSLYMQNNIINLLGFKDRDIKANVTKSSPSSVEVTVSKKVTTEPYFQGIPLKEHSKVKYLIADMYRPFEKNVSNYFFNAIHIFDPFYVIHLINRHLLGYIRRKEIELDDRDRAMHEKIEQDIHRGFEFHHSREVNEETNFS